MSNRTLEKLGQSSVRQGWMRYNLEVKASELYSAYKTALTDKRCFKWGQLSHLINVICSFCVHHCSSELDDRSRFFIGDGIILKQEHTTTFRRFEVGILWFWNADDLCFEETTLDTRVSMAFSKPRDHEKLLRDWFSEFNLDVDKYWDGWLVRISCQKVPLNQKHVFRDNREIVTNKSFSSRGSIKTDSGEKTQEQ